MERNNLLKLVGMVNEIKRIYDDSSDLKEDIISKEFIEGDDLDIIFNFRKEMKTLINSDVIKSIYQEFSEIE